MVVFHSDLDNTLIYSYKRDIGPAKKCVEIYQGREVSFMTDKTRHLLEQVVKQVEFVPTTTRMVEQYERIQFPTGVPHYALACNGGVLLVDGKRDDAWYRESKELVLDGRSEMIKAIELLEADENRCLDIRWIEEMFVFTKSEKPELTCAHLRETLDTNLVDVMTTGIKVYVVPKHLDKGTALLRLKKRIHPDYVIAAGDSVFDVPMLAYADLAILPQALEENHVFAGNKIVIEKGRIYSEGLLEYLNGMKFCDRYLL